MTIQHTAQGAGAPSSAPPSVGAHYTDTTNGDQYLAKGTASVSDWVLQLSKPAADEAYQPKGSYLTPAAADEAYQPKGSYLTPAAADEAYQPKGSYLTPTDADEAYQPKGSYLTPADADEAYQPKGDYATTEQLLAKVDKVEGKQLSTEDFTTEEKNKLAGLGDDGGGGQMVGDVLITARDPGDGFLELGWAYDRAEYPELSALIPVMADVQSLEVTSTDINDHSDVGVAFVAGDAIYLVSEDGTSFVRAMYTGDRITLEKDEIGLDLPATPFPIANVVVGGGDSDTLMVITDGGTVHTSSDRGVSWASVGSTGHSGTPLKLAVSGQVAAMITGSLCYFTLDGGVTWDSYGDGLDGLNDDINDVAVLADGRIAFSYADGRVAFRYSDGEWWSDWYGGVYGKVAAGAGSIYAMYVHTTNGLVVRDIYRWGEGAPYAELDPAEFDVLAFGVTEDRSFMYVSRRKDSSELVMGAYKEGVTETWETNTRYDDGAFVASGMFHWVVAEKYGRLYTYDLMAVFVGDYSTGVVSVRQEVSSNPLETFIVQAPDINPPLKGYIKATE